MYKQCFHTNAGSPTGSRQSAPPLRSQRRQHVIGQSMNNLRSAHLYSTSHQDIHDTSTENKRSTLSRFKSHSAQDLNSGNGETTSTAVNRRHCYVYSRKNPNIFYQSNGNIPELFEPEAQQQQQQQHHRKSVLETALEFQTTVQDHVSSSAPSVHAHGDMAVPIVTSQDGSDVIVSSKSNSELTSPDLSPVHNNFQLRRKKSDPK